MDNTNEMSNNQAKKNIEDILELVPGEVHLLGFDKQALEKALEWSKKLDSYKFLSQFTPEQCRYLESNQAILKKENEELKKDKAKYMSIVSDKINEIEHLRADSKKEIAELKDRLGE